MEKSSQIIVGVLIVLIIVVGVSLLVWPNQQTTITGKAVQSTQTVATPTQTPIKLGVSLPFTGEAASYGQGIVGGIELAVSEVNAAGGVNGRKLVLVKEDDKCASKEGVSAMTKLVSVDKVDAVIGPLCSAAGGASLPVAQASKTPTIFWASAPKLPKTGDYVFRTYPSDSFQGKYAAELLYNKLGKKKVAVVYVQNAIAVHTDKEKPGVAPRPAVYGYRTRRIDSVGDVAIVVAADLGAAVDVERRGLGVADDYIVGQAQGRSVVQIDRRVPGTIQRQTPGVVSERSAIHGKRPASKRESPAGGVIERSGCHLTAAEVQAAARPQLQCACHVDRPAGYI